MAQRVLTLPVLLLPNDQQLNAGRAQTYAITLTAATDSAVYNLRLPKTSAEGYLYNNGNGLTEWRAATTTTLLKDSEFRIQKAADTTAMISFSAASISTGATRVITMPDVDIDLGVVDRFKNLTTAEISQLENIGAYTITNAQWGYLSTLDQPVTTTSSVTFNSVNVTTTLTVMNNRFQAGTMDGLGRSQVWYYGTNDADPDNALGAYSGRGPVCRIGSATAIGDAVDIIAEGIEIYGLPVTGGPMTSVNYSMCVLHPQKIELHDHVALGDTTVFSVNATGLQWRPPGATQATLDVAAALLYSDVPINATSVRVRGPGGVGAPYVELTANPLSTYTVPMPTAPVTKSSYMLTDGTTSTWVEDAAITTNVDLYQYPATYSISGGGAALKNAIIANGGGASPTSPNVYEVTDSLSYDAGIDLTNVSNIVIRGAATARPIISVGTGGDSGIFVQYTAVVHGTTSDITIGNITFNNTAVGSGMQMCVMFERQAGALATDTIGTVSIKNIACINTDYTTVAVNRGGLVVLDQQGDGDFWLTNLYMEDSVMSNQTPRTDRGAPMLMGVSNYVGKYNSFLYPGLTTYDADICKKYYWIRGSNVKESFSFFSRAAYAGNAAVNRSIVWISQENLTSSWANTCSIEFDQCSFSNGNEAATGAIILTHDPTGTPGGALQPITLNVHDCTFIDIRGQGVLIKGDALVHAEQVSLAVTNNTFFQCDCGVVLDPTYISGFASLLIERNTYEKCGATDSGFGGTLVQQAVAADLTCTASMYHYCDAVDYALWTPSAAAYFVTTGTYTPGSGWYTVTFTDGLPSTGWTAGIANRAQIDTATGTITVLEDGLFLLQYTIAATNPEAAKLLFESYVIVDAETPPAAAPTTADQRYKIAPAVQLSAVATSPQPYTNEIYLRLRAGQTLNLALRWAASDPSPPSGAQSFYIQSASVNLMKVGI